MKKNKFIISVAIFTVLVYGSVYGLVTLYFDNLFTRAGKDVLLIALVFYSIAFLLIKKYFAGKESFSLMFFLVSFVIIGACIPLGSGNVTSLMYGLKITVFPLLLIFSGILMTRFRIKLDKVLIVTFSTIIITWIFQYNQGLEALLAAGWEYGVQVKHFNHVVLRLPSSVGTPDDYAFLLSLTGILLEYSDSVRNRKRIKFIIKVVTLVFLLLATIRSAIIFWLIFQLVMSFHFVKGLKRRLQYLVLFLYCTTFSVVPLAIMYMSKSSLSSTSSLEDRFSHWGVHLPSIWSIEGLVGAGLGSVGSASRRTADLGYQSTDYAVDNQYIAFYEQIGVLGCFCILVIISIVVFLILLNIKKTNNFSAKVASCLLVCTFVSGFFTNILELYPFNLFLWTYIGTSLYQFKYESIEAFITQKRKKKKRRRLVW